MKVFRHLPNALTAGNLVCGVYGILHAADWALLLPAYCVWAACVFDFFDGFSARALHVSSPIGKELDSLADVVSFGVLPGLTLFYTMQQAGLDIFAYSAIIVPVASAFRLAKFNVDTRQAEGFIGLPTPANALLLTALPAIEPLVNLRGATGFVWVGIAAISSWLLVSPIRLFALKFKTFAWKGNEIKFTFLLLAVCLIAFGGVIALPVTIVLYICMSVVSGWLGKES